MRKSYLDLIREHLVGLTKGFSKELDGRFLRLTRSEMRICQHIQSGYSTKDISAAMQTSFETIQTHRKNIARNGPAGKDRGTPHLPDFPGTTTGNFLDSLHSGNLNTR